MVRRFAHLYIAGCALAGCVHLPLGLRAPRGGQTITYQLTRCHGACPAYTVTLGPDGQGIFTGEANIVMPGDHRFRATPQQTQSYTAALAKWRPEGERLVESGGRTCGVAVTDQASIDVTWQETDRASHLRLYLGCRSKKARALAGALRGLPVTYLPMQPFLGSD